MTTQFTLDTVNVIAREVFDAASPEAWDNAMVKLLAYLEDDCWKGGDACQQAWGSQLAGNPWRKRAQQLQRWQATLARNTAKPAR